jgi:hypothetical protein
LNTWWDTSCALVTYESVFISTDESVDETEDTVLNLHDCIPTTNTRAMAKHGVELSLLLLFGAIVVVSSVIKLLLSNQSKLHKNKIVFGDIVIKKWQTASWMESFTLCSQ